MSDPTTDERYRHAAREAFAEQFASLDHPQPIDEVLVRQMAARPDFQASVRAFEAGYAAGYGRGRDDEAAGLDVPAWAVRRA